MDKNTIVGLLLMFALILGFSFWNSNQQKKREKERQLTEKVEGKQKEKEADSVAVDSLGNAGQSALAVAESSKNKPLYVPGAFGTGLPKDQDSSYQVKTKIATYSISKKGGYINRVEFNDIYKYTPKNEPKKRLILHDDPSTRVTMELMMKDQSRVMTHEFYFESEQPEVIQLSDGETVTLSLKARPIVRYETLMDHKDSITGYVEFLSPDSYIEYLYTFTADDYRVGFQINMVNMESYLYPNTQSLTLQWLVIPHAAEKNVKMERTLTSIYYMDNLDKVDNLSERGNDKKDFNSDIKWVSFKQQFFTSVVIADSLHFSAAHLAVESFKEEDPVRLRKMDAHLNIPMTDLNQGSFAMTFYMGPNQYKLLKEYDMNLEQQVPLGWSFLLHWINRLAVIPVFNWLESYGLSYGLIILVLTIILKIVLLPIAYKTYLSSAKMRVLKPEIEELNARYPKPEDAMKKQQATMTLYKSAGVNPMAGCLPVLLQMPILIAMFRFFPSSYELRQQPFLWAEDLSTYDSVLDFGFNIPFYGDHVSLFCLLMTIATLVYTWLNNKLMSAGNPDQMKMMKVMMYLMPIMFLGIFNNFASGLTYYYLLVNLITFLQMFIFRYAINEDKLRAKLKANMLKPVKKSRWQKKMDKMLKQQQQMQQKNNKRK